VTIYDGKDLSKFLNSSVNYNLKDSLGIGQENVVGIIGAIDERKRIELFLSVAKEIKRNNLGVKFLIVGDTYGNTPKDEEYKKRLFMLNKALRLEDDVVFTGFQENTSDLLSLFDVFLLTSKRDPLPGVIIEAMAAGKPVVSSAVDGVPELVIEGETGFLIKSDNPIDYANKVLYLLANETMRKEMGAAGKRRAVSLFAVQEHAKAFMTFYSSLLNIIKNAKS
jgi:glycosyltransferase involved in cell wall biosynthesis